MHQHYHQSNNKHYYADNNNMHPHHQPRQTIHRYNPNYIQYQNRHTMNNRQPGNINMNHQPRMSIPGQPAHKANYYAQNSTHDSHEENIKVIKQSRRAVFGNYVVIMALFYLGYYGISKASNNSTLNQLGWFFLVIAIIALIYTESKINYKKLIITNKRAILNEGLLKSNHISIRYSSITEILSSQTLFQRLLNYGNLTIRTSGMKREQDLSITHISNPNYVKKLLERFMIGT